MPKAASPRTSPLNGHGLNKGPRLTGVVYNTRSSGLSERCCLNRGAQELCLWLCLFLGKLQFLPCTQYALERRDGVMIAFSGSVVSQCTPHSCPSGFWVWEGETPAVMSTGTVTSPHHPGFQPWVPAVADMAEDRLLQAACVSWGPWVPEWGWLSVQSRRPLAD